MTQFFRCTHCGRALGSEGDWCTCSQVDTVWAASNRRWCDAIHRGEWHDEEYEPDHQAPGLVELVEVPATGNNDAFYPTSLAAGYLP